MLHRVTPSSLPLRLRYRRSRALSRRSVWCKRAQVAAASRGDIMLPPGNSAYDLYRNALVIDGSNAAALQGLQALPVHRGKAVQSGACPTAISAQASNMLDNLAELAPGEASQGALSDRLAGAWLDQAEQQLRRWRSRRRHAVA